MQKGRMFQDSTFISVVNNLTTIIHLFEDILTICLVIQNYLFIKFVGSTRSAFALTIKCNGAR